MSNNIYLKQGLNIPISGVAAQNTKKVIVPDVVAVKPTDFRFYFFHIFLENIATCTIWGIAGLELPMKVVVSCDKLGVGADIF